MSKTLIRGAMIVDGLLTPAYQADVVISGSQIAEIGAVSPHSDIFDHVIDAVSLTLTPGFIDMHSHSDLIQLANPLAPAKICQGITTELLGQDGLGVAPIQPGCLADYMRHVSGLQGDFGIDWSWRSFGDYLSALETRGSATNLAVLVSHAPLRLAVAGMDERPVTASELNVICGLASQAFAEGAFGFSTGLIYPPCTFAESDELTALARATAAADGIFVVHVRNERDFVKESVAEILQLARMTGVTPHISHLKVIGKENWGGARPLLALFDAARKEGLRAAFDQYPYPAGSTMLSILVPPHAHAGGSSALLNRLRNPDMRQALAHQMANGIPGWENIATAAGWDRVIVTGIPSGPNRQWEGQSLEQIARTLAKTPQEAVFDLLIEENLQVSMINFSMAEEDVALILQHPCGMLGTDGLLTGKPHPRAYGSTARILQKYVLKDKLLSLETAVARMTSRPAMRLGLKNRGKITVGAAADINLINLSSIEEKSSFLNPCQHPRGFEYVIVNGTLALRSGKHTEQTAGLILRKNQLSDRR